MALLIQLTVAALSVVLLFPLFRLRVPARVALCRAGVVALIASIVVTLVLTFATTDNEVYTQKYMPYLFKYAAAYTAAWLPLSVWTLALGGLIRLRRDPDARPAWKKTVGVLLSAGVYGLAGLMGFGAYWIRSYFGEIDIDEVTFVLATGHDHSTADLSTQILNYVTAPTVCAVIVGLLVGLWDFEIVVRGRQGRELRWAAKLTRRIAAVVGVAAVGVTGSWLVRVVPVGEVLFPPAATTYIEDNYAPPTAANVVFPEKKRNIIHIFLESYENTFYDVAEGGAMDGSLMPDMAQLSDENISFSHTEVKGGFYQIPGATFTVGGIVAQTGGVPLKSPVLGEHMQQFNFPSFSMIGDLLKEEGYTTEVMMAANADFGSKRDLFSEHGDFLIFDHAYAQQHGYIPEGYQVWWGYEDDKMYEFAKSELSRLASASEPFYFMLETADTHFPDGYLSEEVTQRPYDEQFSNVVLHSQRQAVELVRWIQEQPFYEDTTIIITGDHLSMDDQYFARKDIPSDYGRTVLNIIVNPAPGVEAARGTTNRQFTSLDLFPTTLAAAGVEIKGDMLGLGVNMFSSTPTLAERDGIEVVMENLKAPSRFYDARLRPEIPTLSGDG
ncbi:LTA synthase family protein [Actinomyces faecalis]|uniref:LTA synthase family protein n=1 Tax=Actinomyces faecalis TaxID=2722820 RepID=UPI001556731C|nr:LTA synthase family protein [Actinomyces faecalis]